MVRLEDSRFCRHLPPEDVSLVTTRSLFRRFSAGESIFREGDEGDGLYLLMSGEVAITARSGPDRDHVLSRMEPGDYFGEMAIFDGGSRSASATARRDCETCFVPASTVLELLQRTPSLAHALVRDASLRMRDFNHRFLRESLKAERLAMVERLARTIVHDFRNPLNVIGIAADMAAAPNASLENRNSSRDRIRHQVEVLNRMMQELLDFTRGVSSDVVLPRVNYADFLRTVLVELGQEGERRGVAIDVPALLPEVELRIDPPRMTRVFTNLTENAFDALSGKVDGRIALRFEVRDDSIVTEISDNGPGIAKEHLPMIFEPFFTAGKAHGTGLGLAICDRIITEHGGKIRVDNATGSGAIFQFELPRAVPGDTDLLPKKR